MDIYFVRVFFQVKIYKTWKDDNCMSTYIRKHFYVKSERSQEDLQILLNENIPTESKFSVCVENKVDGINKSISEDEFISMLKLIRLDIVM